MYKTPYRIVITAHPLPIIVPAYMEQLGVAIVSYISELEFLMQKKDNPLFYTCPYTGSTGYIDTLWMTHGFYENKKDLIKELTEKINEFSENTFNRKMSIILVHPNTCKILMGDLELFVGNGMQFSILQGAKLIRSNDVPEGKFEIY